MHLKITFSDLISFSYVPDLNRTDIRSHCFLQVCCALPVLYIFLFSISSMIHHFNLFLVIARFFFSWFFCPKKAMGQVTYLFSVATPNSITLMPISYPSYNINILVLTSDLPSTLSDSFFNSLVWSFPNFL